MIPLEPLELSPEERLGSLTQLAQLDHTRPRSQPPSTANAPPVM
jgi:hypothetical protein